MGIEPFLVSDALLGAIAQRLIRRVCRDCCISYSPSAGELARFGWSASSEGEVTLYRANTLRGEEIIEARTNGTLCSTCNGVGYKGRVGVYEVLRVSDRIQTAITEGASTERIKEVALDEGMTTLLAYSLNLVQQGYTTLEEVERLIFESGLNSELKTKRKRAFTPHSSPNADVEAPSTNPWHRLQELERQLEALTHQVQELKKELETENG
jgi:type IV pilus assembly protein PilB